MHYYYISGTSRGIGKALALKLLENENNYVIGFSRTNTLKHPNFEFIQIDLNDPENVGKFPFIPIIDADSITLINNSGMIGMVDHIGLLNNRSITEVFMINSIAPAILMNMFVKNYQNFKCKKLILNISSGAAKHPIESWSSYCASKSALDMFTMVAQTEQEISGIPFPIRFLSVAPGIVDTQMQEEIRKVPASSFSEVAKFIRYKDDNKLAQASELARKLVSLIENIENIKTTVVDIRELNF